MAVLEIISASAVLPSLGTYRTVLSFSYSKGTNFSLTEHERQCCLLLPGVARKTSCVPPFMLFFPSGCLSLSLPPPTVSAKPQAEMTKLPLPWALHGYVDHATLTPTSNISRLLGEQEVNCYHVESWVFGSVCFHCLVYPNWKVANSQELLVMAWEWNFFNDFS